MSEHGKKELKAFAYDLVSKPQCAMRQQIHCWLIFDKGEIPIRILRYARVCVCWYLYMCLCIFCQFYNSVRKWNNALRVYESLL